ESFNKETMERYGHGTPDDWMEHNVYSRHAIHGLFLMGAVNIALFGIVPGMLILLTQIVWIPFWAAGVINGVGHWFGYRNRDDVLSRYAKSLKQTYAHELERLRRWSPRDAEVLKSLRRALLRGQPKEHHPRVAEVLDKSRALHTALTMRQELAALWERSSA